VFFSAFWVLCVSHRGCPPIDSLCEILTGPGFPAVTPPLVPDSVTPIYLSREASQTILLLAPPIFRFLFCFFFFFFLPEFGNASLRPLASILSSWGQTLPLLTIFFGPQVKLILFRTHYFPIRWRVYSPCRTRSSVIPPVLVETVSSARLKVPI